MRCFLVALALLTAVPAVAAELPSRPDPKLTPGAVVLHDARQVCTVAWGRDRRHVTPSMKKQVARLYGIDPKRPATEYDHLISRELGGADDVRNLWPQSYTGKWNAHDKDRLENYLHREVCAGRMSLADAQRAIADDWIASYRKYLGEPPR